MLPDEIVGNLVKEIAGEDAIPLVDLIKRKGRVSEFKLAEKLNISVNQVRNLLYKLSSHNLVSFTRKKDKKKGWYIYYWDFDFEKAGVLIKDIKERKLSELNEKLNFESNKTFFVCPNKHIRITFESALETEFKCPECGEVLKEHDNKSHVEDIKKQITDLEKELAVEIKIVKPKKKIRRIKKPGKILKKKIKKKESMKKIRVKVIKKPREKTSKEKFKKKIEATYAAKQEKPKKKKAGWFSKLKKKIS